MCRYGLGLIDFLGQVIPVFFLYICVWDVSHVWIYGCICLTLCVLCVCISVCETTIHFVQPTLASDFLYNLGLARSLSAHTSSPWAVPVYGCVRGQAETNTTTDGVRQKLFGTTRGVAKRPFLTGRMCVCVSLSFSLCLCHRLSVYVYAAYPNWALPTARSRTLLHFAQRPHCGDIGLSISWLLRSSGGGGLCRNCRRSQSLKPGLNWANVCSPNILRTVRRTMIRFLLELLVRRTWFGQFDELYFVLSWFVMRYTLRPELAADAQQTA